MGSDSKMPNILETGRETFTKFSGFWGSSIGYPLQNMEGSAHPIFGGGGGKVEPLTPYLQNGRSGGSKCFVQLGTFEYSNIKS